ncbi:MAG: heavy-metal-associated domain-containing protein [bacterium]|nr:heavy-metal-associated domain-containing protein [bacterium]
MERTTLHIPNISCGHCSATIERELGELQGVTSVYADPTTKMVTVEWEDPGSREGILNLLTEISFPAADA